MTVLKISDTNDYFIRSGKPFFYLADTLWTCFSNVTSDEWGEYLDYRRMQNFNAVQIATMTQWDGGKPDLDIYPFKVNEKGIFDFYNINDEYFKRAQTLLDTAVKKGFVPALVLLWANYVNESWNPEEKKANVIPPDMVGPYTEYIIKMFSRYDPIYILSGDTDFSSENEPLYYLTALKTIKSMCPDALTTLHIGGGTGDIPEELAQPGGIDFYMYQSCHDIVSQDWAYALAEKFCNKPVKRPVVNGEPCYEGHAFAGKYGRFNEFHVRKAIWQSLLSGAKAGITYGALGVWGWYKEGKEFANEGYGGRPLPWRTALRFKGAWDASFAKWIFETYDLFDLEPRDVILNETREIRMSVSRELKKAAIYIPYNCDVKIGMDLSGYDWILVNLSDKLFAKPDIKIENDMSVVKMHDFNSDVLLIGTK